MKHGHAGGLACTCGFVGATSKRLAWHIGGSNGKAAGSANARWNSTLLREQLRLSTIDAANEMARANDAEAKLARCVEALDRVLTEAGMQAHKHGCPERLRRPAKWDEHAPCAGCQAEAALAAAKGGE